MFPTCHGEQSTKPGKKENKSFTGELDFLGLGWQIGQHYSIIVGFWGIPLRDSKATSETSMNQLIRNIYHRY